ncbi:MAG: cysteine desulfurase family protein [Rickettsiaceae bacterium]|nr:cysteine desulfurase family protein [Rickettsiaceae bacterium]
MIYLDNNATTYPLEGLDSYLAPFLTKPLNPSSIHYEGRYARKLLEEARSSVAESLNISINKNERKIIFTSSATEANNLVINNFRNNIVLYSPVCHLSAIEPAKNCNNSICLEVDNCGHIRLQHLEENLQKISGAKFLVTVIMANNETGIIEPLDDIIDLSHKYGGFVHADCAQAYSKMDIDDLVKKIDFITISSHKIGGLTGAGALIAPFEFELDSMLLGGGQEKKARSGTESMIPIISFGFAASNIYNMRKEFQKKIREIRDFTEETLSRSGKSAIIIGKEVTRLPNTLMISMKDVSARLQLMKFDIRGICVSNGSACSSGVVKHSHVLKAMGYQDDILDTSIRVSFGINNTIEDAKEFILAWQEIEREYEK